MGTLKLIQRYLHLVAVRGFQTMIGFVFVLNPAIVKRIDVQLNEAKRIVTDVVEST